MTPLKKSGAGLILASGIVETVVAFTAYWVFYFAFHHMVTSMVLLVCGILGGVLAIIGAVLTRNTKLTGPILGLSAVCLELFATLFLVIQASLEVLPEEASMIILPFFVLPNALGIAGGIMAIVPSKDSPVTPAPAPVEEEKKEEK